jgi:hypothetical protein
MAIAVPNCNESDDAVVCGQVWMLLLLRLRNRTIKIQG